MNTAFHIADICAHYGVKHAVLSPGSRCAPLSVSFARNNNIQDYVIGDERSAAFIGLGIAQKTKTPVALTCTSGTALLNYGPAIAEAYYNQVPLIVISADRPPEWIDQRDGQTIRQKNVLSNHVKASYHLDVDDGSSKSSQKYQETFHEAIQTATCAPAGPVHINVPFREPFYPDRDIQEYPFELINIKNTKEEQSSVDFEKIQAELSTFSNILIVAGQTDYDELNGQVLSTLKTPVVTGVISNYYHIPNSVKHHDIFLKHKKNTLHLAPDLVVSFGRSVLSKNLKQYLRSNRRLKHWHVDVDGSTANTYEKLTKSFAIAPHEFFSAIKIPDNQSYLKHWQQIDQECHDNTTGILLTSPFNEFSVVQSILKSIPHEANLHLANSTPVRYANFISLYDKRLNVYANRGTSGIDGSTSTAYGTAMVSKEPNYFISGDMSFFYDRNAFWNNYLPNNLKIIVLNNHGGGIFRLINGPSSLPELEKYFVTEQSISVENSLKDYDIEFFRACDYVALSEGIDKMQQSKKAFVLEVETESDANLQVFQEVMKFETNHN